MAVTGSLGQTGVQTYFSSPVSLGVTLPANTYPSGAITFNNIVQGQAYWSNIFYSSGASVTVYLCDSAGNNAVQLFSLELNPQTSGWGFISYTNSATINAPGLAGKALYVKMTGNTDRVVLGGYTTVTINTAVNAYSITCSAGTGGSLTASASSAAPGTTVTLYPSASTGYQLSSYTTNPSVTITNNKFTMPSSNITITATFTKISYTITKATSPSGAGTVTTSANSATMGTTVTVSQTPATGYYFNGWQTSPALTITSGSFTMPASNVTITAKYLRRSTASLNTTTLTGNGSVTLTISTESSAYTHKYKVSFGTNMETSWVNVSAGTTSVTISVPDGWSNYIPNAATKTGGTLVLETYSGSTKIGEYTISSLTYAVRSNAVPTIGTITTSVARTIGGTTYANVGNYYVQSHCGVRIQGSASGVLSSSISSMSVSISGYSGGSYTKTVSSGSLDFTTGLLTIAGNATITVTTTDSRGRTASKTATITVTAYTAPSGSLSVWRVNNAGTADDSGTYGKYSYTSAYTAVGSNTLTKTITSQGSSFTPTNATGDIKPGARQTFSIQQEFTITLTLADSFETTTITAKIRSARFIIYVNPGGTKIGFMKATTESIPTGKSSTFEISEDTQVYIGDETLEAYIRRIATS